MSEVLTLEKIRAAKRLLEETAPPPMPRWDGIIRENALLTISKSRRRSWRERLLTWPWRPWRKLHVWSEPDPSIYKAPYNTNIFNLRSGAQSEAWFAHPATAAQVRAEIHRKQL